MPILAKIKNRTLTLKDYKINMGLSQALGSSLILYHNILERVILDNNGMNDAMLAAFLNGLLDQLNFKSITYKRNSLDNKAIEALIKLIKR